MIVRISIELSIDPIYKVKTRMYGKVKPVLAQWTCTAGVADGALLCTVFDHKHRNRTYWPDDEIPSWVPRPPAAWLALTESVIGETND